MLRDNNTHKEKETIWEKTTCSEVVMCNTKK